MDRTSRHCKFPTFPKNMKNVPYYHLQNDADLLKQGDLCLFRQVDLGGPRANMPKPRESEKKGVRARRRR
eukprot:6181180-Pleurochrysis_carterae.AAC.1